MFKRLILLALGAQVTAYALAQTCTNNLLFNSSFQYNLSSWSASGASWQNGNAELCLAGQSLTQGRNAVPGKAYHLKVSASTAANKFLVFGLRFRSAAQLTLDSAFTSMQSPGAFSEATLTKTAPVGTSKVEVVMINRNNACAQVSDVCLEERNPFCTLSASTIGLLCDANGTSGLTADDAWSFDLLVSGYNTGPDGWAATINGQTITGNYNTPTAVPAGLISGGMLTFAAGDKTLKACQTTVQVSPPNNCDDQEGCYGNLIQNARFAQGTSYWSGSGFGLEQRTQMGGTKYNVLYFMSGGFAEQTVPAKPNYAYQLSQLSGAVSWQLEFLDANDQVLPTQSTQNIAPPNTTKLRLRADASADGSFWQVCLLEEPTAQSQEQAGCPDITFDGDYKFIGYTVDGDPKFSKSMGPISWEVCSVLQDGTKECVLESLPYENDVAVANGIITETDSTGVIVHQMPLPSSISDSFSVIHQVIKSDGYYYMTGFGKDSSFMGPSNLLLKIDSADLTVILKTRFPSFGYYNLVDPASANLMLSKDGLLNIVISGAALNIVGSFGVRFAYRTISVHDFSIRKSKFDHMGSFTRLSPDVILLSSTNFQNLPSGGGQGPSSRTDTKIEEFVIRDSTFTSIANLENYYRTGSWEQIFTSNTIIPVGSISVNTFFRNQSNAYIPYFSVSKYVTELPIANAKVLVPTPPNNPLRFLGSYIKHGNKYYELVPDSLGNLALRNSDCVQRPGVSDRIISATDFEPSGVVLYPNPANQNLHIEWAGEIAQITIFDAIGSTFRTTLARQSADLDLSDCAPGTWFVRIEREGRQAVTRMVMVVR